MATVLIVANLLGTQDSSLKRDKTLNASEAHTTYLSRSENSRERMKNETVHRPHLNVIPGPVSRKKNARQHDTRPMYRRI